MSGWTASWTAFAIAMACGSGACWFAVVLLVFMATVLAQEVGAGPLVCRDLVGVDGALEGDGDEPRVAAHLFELSEAQLTVVVWWIGNRICWCRAYLRVIAWRVDWVRASGCLLDAGCTEYG